MSERDVGFDIDERARKMAHAIATHYDAYETFGHRTVALLELVARAAMAAGVELGQERGESKAARYERDWYDAKSEFDAALQLAKSRGYENGYSEGHLNGRREENEDLAQFLDELRQFNAASSVRARKP